MSKNKTVVSNCNIFYLPIYLFPISRLILCKHRETLSNEEQYVNFANENKHFVFLICHCWQMKKFIRDFSYISIGLPPNR